jgi:small-conductance mechanosensitive channel
MEELLKQSYFGNTVQQYLIALGIFIAGMIIIKIFSKIVLIKVKSWADKTKTTLDNFIIKGVEKNLVPLLYFAGLYSALQSLTLNQKAEKVIYIVTTIVLTFFTIRLIISLLRYSLNSYITKKTDLEKTIDAEVKKKQLRGMVTIFSFLIWGFGIVFMLDNMGFNVAAVIAGLGIGGIAIALAAQAILGDLFSYFVIFFDRPFEIGDFIIIDDKMGAVEYIGIKTTKLRSLGGEQLIFSNTDLTNSRVHNYKRMDRRRVVFKINVEYQTEPALLREIPGIIKRIIEAIKDTTFDRAHFFSYGDFSLVYEAVYYVLSPDYNKYMDIQQEINLKIYNEFSTRKIKFAFPTQTLFVNKEAANGNDENTKSKVVK